jgi:hypothetical protein
MMMVVVMLVLLLPVAGDPLGPFVEAVKASGCRPPSFCLPNHPAHKTPSVPSPAPPSPTADREDGRWGQAPTGSHSAASLLPALRVDVLLFRTLLILGNPPPPCRLPVQIMKMVTEGKRLQAPHFSAPCPGCRVVALCPAHL